MPNPYEVKSDYANCSQASQASACTTNAKEASLRERVEALRDVAAEATRQAYDIHERLFGNDGLGVDGSPETDPESVGAAVDWLKRRMSELVRVLNGVRDRL